MALGIKTGGRRKGTPNKATAVSREALAVFVDGNVDRLQTWLDEIHAADGASAAFKAYVSVLEFHLPKMQRIEGHSNVETQIVVSWLPTE